MEYDEFKDIFGSDFETIRIAIEEYIAGGFDFTMGLADIEAFKAYLEDLHNDGNFNLGELNKLLEIVEYM